MSIFQALGVSLALTLILELIFALFWRVKKGDLPLVALANVLTNPVVVLCHRAARFFFPGILPFLVPVLELGAVSVEGYLFSTRSEIRHPWLFSLCANLFSFLCGLLLRRLF